MENCGISWHTNDPDVVLTYLSVAFADGADYLADVALKEQEELFGRMTFDVTAWRAVRPTAAFELRTVSSALAAVRQTRLGRLATREPAHRRSDE